MQRDKKRRSSSGTLHLLVLGLFRGFVRGFFGGLFRGLGLGFVLGGLLGGLFGFFFFEHGFSPAHGTLGTKQILFRPYKVRGKDKKRPNIIEVRLLGYINFAKFILRFHECLLCFEDLH